VYLFPQFLAETLMMFYGIQGFHETLVGKHWSNDINTDICLDIHMKWQSSMLNKAHIHLVKNLPNKMYDITRGSGNWNKNWSVFRNFYFMWNISTNGAWLTLREVSNARLKNSFSS
jgi:hypothetical protein